MVNESMHSSDFQNINWLQDHIYQILKYYYPRCMDYENGGYFNYFLDDGTIGDLENKHLIETSKFIYIFSIGAILDPKSSWCTKAAEHGLKFLQEFHLDKKNGGYFWKLKSQNPCDYTKYAYGHGFALLAASKAYEAGILWAKDIIEYVYELLEEKFWEEKYELYADEANDDFTKLSNYRGQSSNMQICEAMIAAYEATSDKKFLKKSFELCRSVTTKLTPKSGGLVWEHYDENWNIDWDYKELDENKKLLHPEGFIPGHSIQWSKLLLMLKRNFPQEWMGQKAEYLYNTSMSKAVDNEYGGLFYSLARNNSVIDSDKYYYVMAETLGASALLAADSKEAYYWNVYTYIFTYCETFFIDSDHGCWYEKLSRKNEKYKDLKNITPTRDYHPIAACYEAIRALKAIEEE
ncbi:AGE family epimerase/isomerase [Clostridium sp. C8-1-8]|uniref:AGE family epimerase/isomerase n=1 Tax=Clostridium sp. C8-1-8 TaxID=2698831 RepID=UPI00136D68D5|nr:AGE family epimerase/isomerase [Clostridium sp. C8-1-8]